LENFTLFSHPSGKYIVISYGIPLMNGNGTQITQIKQIYTDDKVAGASCSRVLKLSSRMPTPHWEP